MKIECSSCQSKYAVPDEKVAGRKVRIRCRKCQAAIIVDGTVLAAAAEPQAAMPAVSHSIPAESMPAGQPDPSARRAQKTLLGLSNPDEVAAPPPSNDNRGSRESDRPRAQVKPVPVAQSTGQAPVQQGYGGADYADAAASYGNEAGADDGWLVAVDGQPMEMTTAQIYEAYQSGAIDNETYIWREGMDNWAVPAEIPELASMLASAHVTDAPAPQSYGAGAHAGEAHAAVAAPALAPGADFDDEDEPTRVADLGQLLSDSPGSQSAQFALAAHAGSEEMLQQEEAARAAGRAKRAQKAKTAPQRPRPPTPQKTAPKPQHLPIEEGPSENSVMFSLDALVGTGGGGDAGDEPLSKGEEALLLGLPEPANDPPLPFDMTSPQFGNAVAEQPKPQPAVAAPIPMAMPTTASVAQPLPKSSKLPLVAALLVLMAGGAGFWFYQQSSLDQTTTAALNPDAQGNSGRAGEVQDGRPEGTKPQSGDSEDGASEPTPADSAEPSDDEASGIAGASSAAKSATATATTPTTTTPTTKPTRARAAVKPTRSTSKSPASSSKQAEDKKEDLKKKDEVTKTESNGNAFSTSAAKSALGAASARAAASCKGGATGKGQVQVTFVPSGKATRAVVGGDFAGTTTGGCIARVFRSSSVPPFDGAPVTVAKTVSIK